MTTSMATPRRSFAAAGSAALGSTAGSLGPGGCPFEVTMPKWLQKKEEAICESSKMHPTVVFVLGGPASGKSTMCGRIAKEFRYVHLNIGDLLRAEQAKPGSQDAHILDSQMSQRLLVPAELTVRILMTAIESHENWKRAKFLIDGFPRNIMQLEVFNQLMGKKVALKTCLFFDSKEDVLESRLLALSSREVDEELREATKQRVSNYAEEVLPIIRLFQYEGLFERIDANRDVEKVWTNVQQYFIVEGYTDVSMARGGNHNSPAKNIWKLRDKQSEEIVPGGHSHTSSNYVKGPDARQFNSYTILNRHRDKHTRNMRSPIDNFVEPMTLAQEIGWHQPDEGEQVGAKGTPRNSTTPRSFYPRNTCSMTRHMENMYSTNAQHIIRRW